MSVHDFRALNFDLREDLPASTLRVLVANARDERPDETDLATLHPVVRWYLGDWRRMLDDEVEQVAGPSIRLSRLGRVVGEEHVLTLSIEYSQHDDEFANGGWIFWTWLYSLARREPSSRGFIGYHTYMRRQEQTAIRLTEGGIVEGTELRWQDLEDGLRHAEPWGEWESYPR